MNASKPASSARRRALLGLGAACLLGSRVRELNAHSSAGRVLPALPAPDFAITTHDGRRTTLPRLLAGKATALQLMFTGCTSTCPIQGALFAASANSLAEWSENHPARGRAQLVSVSVDPLNDDPAAMRRWLHKHGAGPGWIGVTPEFRDIDRWFDFLKVRVSGPDRHTAQVYFFDVRGALAMRTVDFPKPQEVARSLLLLSTIS